MRHRVRPAPGPRRSANEQPATDALAGLSNQALVRLLATKPKPTRTPIAPIANLYGTIDEKAWAAAISGNQSVLPLYADLATQLNATVIPDVKGTAQQDINTSLTVDASTIKPGLNFVARLGSKGQCFYLYGDGTYGVKLPTGRKDKPPEVAICLGKGAFVAGNKAFALATLRHELEHAAHDRMAVTWLERWQAGASAKADFRSWLKSQPIAAADLALIRERIDDSNVNTELLAHAEGFIASFEHENRATAGTSRSVYEQLWGVVDHWGSADAAVRVEAVTRLLELKGRLKGADRQALVATMQRLKAEKTTPPALVDPLI